jgi:hypothetical protein
MKNVMIQYTLHDDADLDAVKAAITGFVGGLHETSDRIHYTSYEKTEPARSFVHIGYFPDEATVKEAQSRPFFGEFSAFLKQRCAEGPGVTWLSTVASTHQP